MSEKKQYTRSEVAKTNGGGRTLIILHDKVYEITNFLNEHPGGEEILLDHGGKDASEDFDDVGHSMDAFELMKKYHIGELVETDRSNKPPKKGWVAGYKTAAEQDKNLQSPGAPLYLLLAGVAIVVAVMFYVNS